MLKNERQNLIMEIIKREQYVKVTELKEQFSVSDETIRRDLNELEKSGRIHCVHGGAVLESSSVNEFDYMVRVKQNQIEKDAICREAAKLVNERESIAILGSSTTLFMADALERKNNITVVTNSIYLANKLSKNRSNEVIFTGGVVNYDEQRAMGALTEYAISKTFVDKAFFSVAGITIENGITEYNEMELRVVKCVMKNAKQSILMMDHTKFGFAAFRQIYDIKSVHSIVTDWHTPSDVLREYEALGIDIRKAEK